MKHFRWLAIALLSLTIFALSGCASSRDHRYYGQRYPAVYSPRYPYYDRSDRLYRLEQRQREREWRRLQRQQERYERRDRKHGRRYRY